jgi:NitT/TauT family transport system substrate-binding protein
LKVKKVQAFGRLHWPQHYGGGQDDAMRVECGNLAPSRTLAEPSMKKLVLETTAPFQGLPELVADREGLFAKEGLQIEWVERESDDKSTHVDVNTPKGLNPFSSHGKMLEQGRADMYNACEWGNYCRVQDTQVGSRQVGRRGIVTYAAIVVRPDSQVFTGQQLAGKTVGVPFYFGTHYLALHLLEGFMPREDIKLCRTSNGSRPRFDAMMRGEIEATTLTEPYVTLAEKQGCRLICEAFYHGTEVASDRVDAETYGAFNRAVREAVKRINADKAKYLHYFIDYHAKKDAEIGRLTPQDLRASRVVVCDPAPIPLDEMQRTYDWLKSWGMLEQTATPLQLVNLQVQQQAHTVAAE